MSLSRRDVRRLRSAGWEVVEVSPAATVRRVLWWLVTGGRLASAVSVVDASDRKGDPIMQRGERRRQIVGNRAGHRCPVPFAGGTTVL